MVSINKKSSIIFLIIVTIFYISIFLIPEYEEPKKEVTPNYDFGRSEFGVIDDNFTLEKYELNLMFVKEDDSIILQWEHFKYKNHFISYQVYHGKSDSNINLVWKSSYIQDNRFNVPKFLYNDGINFYSVCIQVNINEKTKTLCSDLRVLK
jgi:hypothetical protein